MGADYPKMMDQLRTFYDFNGKIVLFVGAGGGQLLDPSVRPKKLIAIDHDPAALAELQRRVTAKGMQDMVEIICAKFEDVTRSADVVYFEFCLHEMDDAMAALKHAHRMAPDIVVYDHAPGSEWIYYGAEEDKVARSAEIMTQHGVRRSESYRTDQRFRNYQELLAKVSPQGAVAIERAQRFEGVTNIVIPMDYGLTLL